LREFFSQIQEGENATENELAVHVGAMEAATTGIALETPEETEARMMEIKKRAQEIERLVGGSMLDESFKDQPYVSRDERARINHQREMEKAKALGIENIPARSWKYRGGNLPSTAQKAQQPQGLFSRVKGFFGGN
jgi:hypothetical protein